MKKKKLRNFLFSIQSSASSLQHPVFCIQSSATSQACKGGHSSASRLLHPAKPVMEATLQHPVFCFQPSLSSASRPLQGSLLLPVFLEVNLTKAVQFLTVATIATERGSPNTWCGPEQSLGSPQQKSKAVVVHL